VSRIVKNSGIIIIFSQLPVTIGLGALMNQQRQKIIALSDERIRVMRYLEYDNRKNHY
jgi:hypothetical protein